MQQRDNDVKYVMCHEMIPSIIGLKNIDRDIDQRSIDIYLWIDM